MLLVDIRRTADPRIMSNYNRKIVLQRMRYQHSGKCFACDYGGWSTGGGRPITCTSPVEIQGTRRVHSPAHDPKSSEVLVDASSLGHDPMQGRAERNISGRSWQHHWLDHVRLDRKLWPSSKSLFHNLISVKAGVRSSASRFRTSLSCSSKNRERGHSRCGIPPPCLHRRFPIATGAQRTKRRTILFPLSRLSFGGSGEAFLKT